MLNPTALAVLFALTVGGPSDDLRAGPSVEAVDARSAATSAVAEGLPGVENTPGAVDTTEAVDTTGAVKGVVTGLHRSGPAPVAHAAVEFVGAWGTESVRTDDLGRYELESLPEGRSVVRFRHIGFHSHVVEVDIRAGDEVGLDVKLDSRPVALEPVHVGRQPLERLGTTRARTTHAGQSMEVEVTAAQLGLADPGLVAAARNTPPEGGDGPGEVLFMRGSTTDLRRVLLDGVPVFSPFHVAGLLPSFHGELLSEAGAYVGGAPARYDGSLSQVLDLQTRTPRRDRFRTGGSVDGMSGRLTLEGPIGPSGAFALAGRALHDLQPRVLDDSRSPYGYRDALLRIEEQIYRGHRISFTGFWNRESVRLDPERTRQRLSREGTVDVAGSPAPSEAVWSNRAMALTYSGRWGSTWTTVTAGQSLYDASLPLNLADPVFVRGWTGQRRLGMDLARESRGWEVRSGGSVEELEVTFRAPGIETGSSGGGGSSNGFRERDAQTPGSEGAVTGAGLGSGGVSTGAALASEGASAAQPGSHSPEGAAQGRAAGSEAVVARVPSRGEDDVLGTDARTVGGYLEGRRPLGDEFSITVGGRVEYFGEAGDVHLSPRASGEWRLTEDAVLTLTAGRYHQLVQADDDETLARILGEQDSQEQGVWEPKLDVAAGSHLVTSLGQNLTEQLRLDLSGFLKRFDGLPETPEGRLNTSGVDLRVIRSGDRLGGWLGYNLGWFWSGGAETRDFTGRHLVAGGITGSIGGWADARLSTVYGAGLPYTGVPLMGDEGGGGERSGGVRALSVPAGVDEGPPVGAEPMEDFLRVDLELTGEWDMEVGSRTTTFRPYVKVLNALDRRDALFVYFDDWRDDAARPLAERPLLPLLGIEWSF